MTPEQAAALVAQKAGKEHTGAQWADIKYQLSTIGKPSFDGNMLDANGMPKNVRGNPSFQGGKNGGSLYQYQVTAGTVYGDVNIAEQEQAPDNPGIRKQAFSTYGITIPLSIGSRRITGNILEASSIVPTLEGTRKYSVEYKLPIYPRTDPEVPE